jgi:hypothetical protein
MGTDLFFCFESGKMKNGDGFIFLFLKTPSERRVANL